MRVFDLFKPNVERMEAEKDTEGLIKALGYRRNANVRKKAAEALGRVGKSAIEQLVRALNDKDQSVREGAREAIVRLATRNIAPFGEIFERDGVDIDVKRSLMLVLQIIPGAIRALATYHIPPLGTQAGNDDAMEAKSDVKGPIEALAHKDSDVRIQATEALAKIGDARAVAALIQTAKADVSVDVELSASRRNYPPRRIP